MPSIIAKLYEDAGTKKEYKKTGKYTLPLYETIDPKKKDTTEYCRDITRAAFSMLIQDKNFLPGTAYSYMQTLRDYGNGNQNESKYINMFLNGAPSTSSTPTSSSSDVDGVWTSTAKAKRKALENINTKIVSVATNLMNAIQGIFSVYDENCYVNSVDNSSIEEEERKMYDILFDVKNIDFLKSIKNQYGMDLSGGSQMPSDVTLEELEIYKDMGGFRGEHAIAVEELIKYTELMSDWDSMKKRYVNDIVKLNMISGLSEYDLETCEERWKYCDPGNVTMQYSMDGGFKDAEYGGYFELVKVSKLVQMGFPSKEIIKSAKKYAGMYNNIASLDWGRYTGPSSYDNSLLDMQVPVYHHFWKDCNIDRKLKIKDGYGREINHRIDFGKEIKPISDYRAKKGVEQSEIKTRKRIVYQCSWVVGTDMVYNYGPRPNQSRESKKEPMLPIFVRRGINDDPTMMFGSIIESIIPYLDNLQMAWLKYQDALIKSHPGGWALNLRLLRNLTVGGEEMSELEAFNMFYHTGRLPYQDIPLGERYRGGEVFPIKQIEGNLGALMAVTAEEIHRNLQFIEKATGINPAPLGQTPQEDQTATATRIATAGTNNVLRPLFDDIFSLKEKLADCSSKRIQLLIRNNPASRDAYDRIIGGRKVEMLRQMERNGAEYGMYLETRATDKEIQSLMSAAEEALSPGRDGKIQINLSQWMYIFEQIRSGGNIKKLSRDLSFMIRRNEEMQAQIADRNVQAQAGRQAKQENLKAQQDLILKQADAVKQKDVDNNKAKNEAKLEQLKSNLKYKENLMNTKKELLNAISNRRYDRQTSGTGVAAS